jgi:hypothetical protein
MSTFYPFIKVDMYEQRWTTEKQQDIIVRKVMVRILFYHVFTLERTILTTDTKTLTQMKRHLN